MRLRLRIPRVPGLLPGTSVRGVLVSAALHLVVAGAIAALASLRPTPRPLESVYTVSLVEEPRPGPGGGPRPQAAAPQPEPKPEPEPTPVPVEPPAVEKETPKPVVPEVAEPKPRTPAPRTSRSDPVPKKPSSSNRIPSADDLPPAAAAPPRAAPGASGPTAGLVAGAAGGDGGIPTIDSEAFPFLYYRQILTNRLSSTWSRPVVPGGLSTAIRATVRFEVLRSGALSDIALVTASGYPSLDRSALRAVHDANPLPPLPDQFTGDRLGVHFYFELVPEGQHP